MLRLIAVLLLGLSAGIGYAQFTSQTYPDPRSEPFRCKLLLPGQVCDPNDILTDEERRHLNDKIQQLSGVTNQIKNSSPQCANSPNQNLQIVVALLEKIGASPLDTVDIESFTSSLRLKYLNFQDLGCDTLVLIVNSRRDRQVFTVAGRDAKLSRDVLQTAFHRNIGHFRSGRYVMGLEGMVEYVVSSYSSVHIVQVPSPDSLAPVTSSGGLGTGSNVVTHGIRQIQEGSPGMEPSPSLDLVTVPEDDRIWVEIIQHAAARCGSDKGLLTSNVRAVVEEAMRISLKLISDPRYNQIEETSQTPGESRDKAWTDSTPFVLDLFEQYRDYLGNARLECPRVEDSATPQAEGFFPVGI